MQKITKKEELLFRAVTKTKKAEYLRKINSAISYQTVRSSVLKAASKAGIDVSTIGTHSLQAGGASAAANNGVEDRLFKRHGRWKSERAQRWLH